LGIFKDIWPTFPVQRRRSIMKELMEITETNFEVDFNPLFLLALGDEDAEVRSSAIKCLWEDEHPSLIQPFIHLLKTDEAVVVRENAASALGKFVYLKEIEEIEASYAILIEEALMEIIYNEVEDVDVRRRAIEAMSFSVDPRVPAIIEAAYYSDHERMQISAIFAMGRNADIRWLPLIMKELDNPNTEIRFEAVRACGELEAVDAAEQLIMLIDEDPDFEIVEVAIWALGRIGGTMAREALEICVESDNEAIVSAATEALDELNLFGDDQLMLDFGEEIDLFDEFDEFNPPNGHGNGGNYVH
jgi:HEAT repeat protein